jgi:hypothetical protein
MTVISCKPWGLDQINSPLNISLRESAINSHTSLAGIQRLHNRLFIAMAGAEFLVIVIETENVTKLMLDGLQETVGSTDVGVISR